MKKVLFFILLPVYGTIGVFMFLTFEWWSKLLEPPKKK